MIGPRLSRNILVVLALGATAWMTGASAPPSAAWAIPNWVRSYGGSTGQGAAALVHNETDGGFVFGGTAPGPAGDLDLWLFKVDALGTVQWAKTYGTSHDDSGAFQPTPDGGFAALGSSLDGSGQVTGWWVVKTDGLGGPVWQHTLSVSSGLSLFSMVSTADGTVLAGGPKSAVGFPSSLWLAKFDGAGNLAWQRGYSPGFFGVVPLALVQALPGGDLLVSGTVASILTQDANLFLMRLDASDGIRWQKSYGGPRRDVGGFALPTSDGGFLLDGATLSWGAGGTSDGYGDAWVLKLDGSGNLLWQRAYGGLQDDLGLALPDPAGGYILSGFTSSFGAGGDDIWALKLDDQGAIVWQKAFGGAGTEAGFVVPDPGGGYLMQGTSDSLGSGTPVLWVAGLDGGCGVLWQKAYGGPGPDLQGMGFQAAANLLTQGFGILPDGGLLLSGETPGPGPQAFWAMRAAPDGGLGAPCDWVGPAQGAVTPISATVTSTTAQAAAGGFSASSSSFIVQAASLTLAAVSSPSTPLCVPPLSAAATAVPSEGTAPLTVAFDAAVAGGTPPYTFAWSFGDGAQSSSESPSHLYGTPGIYSVSLTVTDADSGTATDAHLSITVRAPLPPPVVALIKKVSPPFKLMVTGSNLQNGIKVYIDGVEWASVAWKKTTKIQLTGPIKTAVPKGVPKTFRFLNPDGGECTTTWNW